MTMIDFSIFRNLKSDILDFLLDGDKLFVLSSKVKNIGIPLHQFEYSWSYPFLVNACCTIIAIIVIKYQSDIRNYFWSNF